jgi:type IV secretory pathway VirB10-like protein
MNTFWLKFAGAAVVAVVLVIVIGVFMSSNKAPVPQPGAGTEAKPKTVYDMFDRDDKKFAVKPQPEDSSDSTASAEANAPAQPTQPTAPTVAPQPKFVKLSFENEVEAQKLYEWAKNQRKMGRLPIMGYKQMVDACREIIRRWPQSQYAFLSKQMLADLPERYYKMYNITKEELDTSSFYK